MVSKFKSEIRNMRNIAFIGIILAIILSIAIIFTFGQ